MSEYNKQRKENDDKQQKFYFNEDGQLVVESARGVWVDGKQYVKMYGQFTCNAKTLGIIIERFKGLPVVVAETTKNTHYDLWQHCFEETTSAIVNPTDDDKGLIRQNDMLSARNNNISKQVEDLSKQVEDLSKQVEDLKAELEIKKDIAAKYFNAIDKFNKLPWWKRMFKKIEVK